MAKKVQWNWREPFARILGNAKSMCLCATTEEDVNELKELIRMMPTVVRFKDGTDCRRIFLLSAIAKNRPLDIIKILVEAWPDSVREKDDMGKLAIHIACEHHDQLDVFQALIQQWPGSIRERDNHGNLPIHCIVKRLTTLPIPILELLLSGYPDSVTEVDENQNTVLHCVLLNQHIAVDEDMLNLILQRGGAAVRKCNKRGQTPLLLACARCGENVIRIILGRFRQAAQWKDSGSRYPLHILCNRDDGSFIAVGGAVLEANRAALREKDRLGNYPLHYAVKHHRDGWNELIQLMIYYFPGAVFHVNNNGLLPLHLACKNHATDRVISLLVNEEPETVTQSNYSHCIPLLYLLLRNGRANNSTIRLLVEVHPATIAMVDGRYSPFHYAMMNYPEDTVMMMVQMFPRVLQEKAINGIIYPLVHAINSNKDNLVEYFLNVCPMTASIRNGTDGYLPLHYACMRQPPMPLAVMDLLVDSFPAACFRHCLYVAIDDDSGDDSDNDDDDDSGNHDDYDNNRLHQYHNLNDDESNLDDDDDDNNSDNDDDSKDGDNVDDDDSINDDDDDNYWEYKDYSDNEKDNDDYEDCKMPAKCAKKIKK